jgi:hypothetical protein
MQEERFKVTKYEDRPDWDRLISNKNIQNGLLIVVMMVMLKLHAIQMIVVLIVCL